MSDTRAGAPTPSALTPAAERWIVRSLVAVFAIICTASAVLSSTGLHALGVSVGLPSPLAWLLPVTCDGLIAAGLLSGLYGTLSITGTHYAHILVIIGTLLSVGGNVIAAPPGIVAQVVHAGPPVVLALALEAVLGPIRRRAMRRGAMPAHRAVPAPSVARQPVSAKAKPPALPVTRSAPAEPSPQAPTSATSSGTVKRMSKAAHARALFTENPERTVEDVVAICDIDPREARKARKAATAAPAAA